MVQKRLESLVGLASNKRIFVQYYFNFYIEHISGGVTPAVPFYLDRPDKPCESFIIFKQRRGA